MGEKRFIILLLILFLNFIGTIFVVFQQHREMFYGNFILSLFFIAVGIVFLYGLYKDRPWAYQIGMLLFAAILIHVMLLRYEKGSFLRFLALAVVDAAGFLICLGSLESYDERKFRLKEAKQEAKQEPSVEVYEEKAAPKKAETKEEKKRTKRKK